MHKRSRGNKAEALVAGYYQTQGWTLLHQNFTIKGGEIDLIFSNHDTILFVEVKDVSAMYDLQEYITPVKRMRIKKTIEHYLWKYPTTIQQRCDVVFVKGQNIYTVIDNCIDF